MKELTAIEISDCRTDYIVEVYKLMYEHQEDLGLTTVEYDKYKECSGMEWETVEDMAEFVYRYFAIGWDWKFDKIKMAPSTFKASIKKILTRCVSVDAEADNFINRALRAHIKMERKDRIIGYLLEGKLIWLMLEGDRSEETVNFTFDVECEIYKEEIGNAFKIERLIKELRLEEPTVPPEVDVPPVTPDIDDSQKRSFAPQR